ncbi:MAG: (2Fe-2S)-binding protein [Peptococcaceae bacterium]|jgi:NAD(P)H-nitrite reductase large subunit|nr:(2Fe-2S)-binding protein [Peptococcaceae bacterium]
MENADQEIIICRCEEISRRQILAAIADGATTIKGVKIRTEAGMGLCQGRTCRRLITQMLAQSGARPAAELYPPTSRPPVRTAQVGEYIREEDD